MTDKTPATEPTTEAGREADHHWPMTYDRLEWRELVCRIEAQARAEALDVLRGAVEGLISAHMLAKPDNGYCRTCGGYWPDGHVAHCAYVHLRAILTETKPPTYDASKDDGRRGRDD